MRAAIAACALALLASAAGCATGGYAYLPVEGGGGPAARYPIPPGAPQGEVYITSFGLTDLDVAPGQPGRMLHVRLAVSNASAFAWALDGRQQQLEAPGLGPQTPAFLNTDAGQGPIYQVLPGRANAFDLYYALPPPLDQAAQLSGFALDWRVDVPGQTIAQQTPFQRVSGSVGSYDPYPPYVTVGLGFGVGWWYGPGYVYRPGYSPLIRHYYYPPRHSYGGPWRGPPPGAWRGTPPGTWHGTPSGGGWRGAPPPRSGGGWHGSPPPSRSVSPGWRGAPPSAPRSAPAPRGGGGWRGGR
jgi:hypothetical protein